MGKKVLGKILNLINENYLDDTSVIWGLRVDKNKYNVGDITNNSYRWEDDKPTDKQLSGTCAIGINNNSKKAIKTAWYCVKDYCGDNIYLLHGKKSYKEKTQDIKEVIIKKAEVIDKFGRSELI